MESFVSYSFSPSLEDATIESSGTLVADFAELEAIEEPIQNPDDYT